MARSLIEANARIGRVRSMPYGRARSEAAEREVRRIEREGPPEAKAYALTSLVEALTWGDDYEAAFRPFAQLLRWWDEHPEHFDKYDQSVMFWEFGWIMSDLPQTPSVSRTQVEALLNDMERRFALANRGMERVWSTRLDWALATGQNVSEVFTHWLTLPIDDDDSCAACHEALRAEYLTWSGDRLGAIAVLETATTADLTCSREPAAMLTDLVLAYLDEGRLDDAEALLPKALAELGKARATSLSSAYARLFELYGRTRRPDLAVTWLAERAKDLDNGTPYHRLILLRRILAGATALVQAGLGETETGWATAINFAALADWAWTQADDLTTQFDQRNQSTEQRRRLEHARATTTTPRPLVLALPQAGESAEALVTEILGAEPVTDQVEAATAEPLTDWQLSLAEAEAYLESAQLVSAAQAYQRSAAEAQAAGELTASGWAWAEAAHCYQLLDRPVDTADAYEAALDRLLAVDRPIEDLAQIIVTWAPGVGADQLERFLAAAGQAMSLLLGIVAEPGGGQPLDDLADMGLAFRPIGRQLRARADLEDATARVLATWGDAAVRDQASGLATSAAAIYLSLGALPETACAEWLAGTLATGAGDTAKAIEWLEAARGHSVRLGKRELATLEALDRELAVLRPPAAGSSDSVDSLGEPGGS